MTVNSASRTGNRGAALLSLLAVFVARAAVGQDTPERLPVPDAARQQQARALVADVFGEERRRAQTPVELAALADKMIRHAVATADDANGQFALLDTARQLAVEAADAATAWRAVRETSERFQIDGPTLALETLTQTARNARTPEQNRRLTVAALDVVDVALAAERVNVALQAAVLAGDRASKARDAALRRHAAERKQELEKIAETFAQVEAARQKLNEAPTDPEANLLLGRFRCFVLDDWERGLPMLALGSDKGLADAAVQELEGVKPGQRQADLGDAWWNLAEAAEGTEAAKLRWRAKTWYRKALPQLAGLTKVVVEKRLASLPEDELAAALARLAPAAVLVMTFDRNTFARRGKEVFVRDLSGHANHGLVRGATPAAGKLGQALSFTPQNYVDCGNAPSLDPGDEFSICVWAYPIKGPDYPRLVSKFGTYQLRWQSYYTDPGPVQFIGLYGTVQAPQMPPYEKWHHVAITCGNPDRGGKLKMYLNGSLVAEAPALKPIQRDPSGHLYLGVSKAGHKWEHYQGLLDELAIFNRELRAEEVDALYCRGMCDASAGSR